MRSLTKQTFIAIFSLALLSAIGCSNDNDPVQPATMNQQPTSEAPPPGPEERLPEEGP